MRQVFTAQTKAEAALVKTYLKSHGIEATIEVSDVLLNPKLPDQKLHMIFVPDPVYDDAEETLRAGEFVHTRKTFHFSPLPYRIFAIVMFGGLLIAIIYFLAQIVGRFG